MINIAHIHPMLVHFPIVLFLFAVALEGLVLLRSGDLTANNCLANTALAALLLAALAAVVTASFGDMALDHAVALGFPKRPMEIHAALGFSTMWFMLVLSAYHLLARWRRWKLAGGRGWLLFVVALLGVALLIFTAYHGGELVYHYGVNVDAVKP